MLAQPRPHRVNRRLGSEVEIGSRRARGEVGVSQAPSEMNFVT